MDRQLSDRLAPLGGGRALHLSLILAAALAGLLTPSVVWARPGDVISGTARITDGDTLRLGEARIRMHGIDAPEKAQPCTRKGKRWACGMAAKEALESLVDGAIVRCIIKDVDRYRRMVGECFAQGRNLNRAMVSQGWAMAYRAYSRDYIDVEDAARAARRGLWAGEFDMPWDWRKSRRRR